MDDSQVEPGTGRSLWVPWEAARRLFGGPPPAGSRALGALATARSVLGLLTLLVLGRGDRGVYETLDEEGWVKATITILIGLVVVPVAVVVLRVGTRPGFRSELRSRPVVTKVVLLLLTSAATMAPIILSARNGWLESWLDDLRAAPGPFAVLVLPVVVTALSSVVWVALFVGNAAWWAVRTTCFVGDYHPLLGPAVTAVVVGVATAVSLVQAETHGLSGTTWLVLTLGGPVTTFVLVAVEYALLRARGIGWRTGPNPHAGPR
ncbi:hypothetical protein ACFQV2_23715 [Actinokineospora soli]|uniref:Integral membrane protein n=1 Tax=Actinokineospora soli TaxID=1048753 RepID=A0ABW2TQE1_9PSEU